ncbi:MAG TPA: hypothetical protein VGE45_00970 [Chloroflexia bacterium]|jgi:hypothetical protein
MSFSVLTMGPPNSGQWTVHDTNDPGTFLVYTASNARYLGRIQEIGDNWRWATLTPGIALSDAIYPTAGKAIQALQAYIDAKEETSDAATNSNYRAG